MKIKEIQKWDESEVRRMCIKNNLYTSGTNEHYNTMLDYVRNVSEDVKTSDIYNIAYDIWSHTPEEESPTVEGIMFMLSNEVITRYYEIN